MRNMLLLVFVLTALAFALPAISAQTVPAQPSNLDYLSKKVVFKHESHADLECKACHHSYEGEGVILKCSHAGCHDVLDRKDKSVQSLYQAFHGKGSAEVQTCVSCHKEVAKEQKDRKKELTSCIKSACHPE